MNLHTPKTCPQHNFWRPGAASLCSNKRAQQECKLEFHVLPVKLITPTCRRVLRSVPRRKIPSLIAYGCLNALGERETHLGTFKTSQSLVRDVLVNLSLSQVGQVCALVRVFFDAFFSCSTYLHISKLCIDTVLPVSSAMPKSCKFDQQSECT